MKDADLDPAELYHANSKLWAHDGELFSWFRLLSSSPVLRDALSRPAKAFSGVRRVRLPAELPAATLPFDQVFLRRRSIRKFTGAVTLAQLAKIMLLTYGELPEDDNAEGARRYTPSAGALYPLELYAVVRDAEGLAPGLYHLAPRRRELECLRSGDVTADLAAAFASPEVVNQAAGVLLLTAVFERCRFKYRKRSYRFVLLETGHAAQNALLGAASIGLGAVALGGFLDAGVEAFLGIDGLEESIVYAIAFGQADEALSATGAR
jgi:SagB-type dehydrogenase family enzyme